MEESLGSGVVDPHTALLEQCTEKEKGKGMNALTKMLVI